MSMTLQEKIDVMSAYQRGARVQARMRGTQAWATVSEPGWNFFDLDYRVEPPKPREGYVHRTHIYEKPGAFCRDWVHIREIVESTGDRSAPPGGSISPQRNY